LQFVGSLFENLLIALALFIGEKEDSVSLFAEDGVNAVFVEVDEARGCFG
jgi:hypothetical protein